MRVTNRADKSLGDVVPGVRRAIYFDAAEGSAQLTFGAAEIDPGNEIPVHRHKVGDRYVEEGFFDIGITGRDWVRETEADVEELASLEYAKGGVGYGVRVVLAVPQQNPAEKAADGGLGQARFGDLHGPSNALLLDSGERPLSEDQRIPSGEIRVDCADQPALAGPRDRTSCRAGRCSAGSGQPRLE